MKKVKQIIFGSIFLVCCFLGIFVSANDYDFYETKSFSSEDDANKELELQLERAKEYSESLDDCTYLEYEGSVTSTTENLDEEIVETEQEKNEKVTKYESNGYTVSFDVTEDEAVSSNYSFSVLNGKVTSATIGGEVVDTYNGKTINSVLKSFNDEDNSEFRVKVSISSNVETVNDSDVFVTEEEAKAEVARLNELGYEASYVQNNSTSETVEIESEVELTEEEINSQLEDKNSNKEVKDVEVLEKAKPSTYTSEKTTDKSVRDAEMKEYEDDAKWDSVSGKEYSYDVINKEKTTQIANDVEYTGTDVVEYNKKIENADGTGYRVYTLVENGILVEGAKSIEKNFLTESECNSLKTQYAALGYKNLTCTPVTTTTLERNQNNKYIFNSDKGVEMSWVHLDISIEQEVVLYEEDGVTVKDRLTGTIVESPRAWLNKGTEEEVAITYKSGATADGDRYEYRSSTDSSFSYDDYVTLEFKIRYTTSDGVVHEPTITLEGYLKNIFNVCKDKNSTHNRGFDLEISITVDANGDEVVNFTTSTVYTFTADKDAVYKDKVTYDEYVYGNDTVTEYWFEAEDVHYAYEVSYVATDYTVSYEGSEGEYEVVVEEFDKNYVINGSKTTYTATTYGVIKEREMCEIGDQGGKEDDEEEEIVPPHTDSDAISNYVTFNAVAIFEDKKKIRFRYI